MKIVEAGFEIIDFPTNALEKIERAGRICYASDPSGDPSAFVKRLIERQHLTPLEMASVTVKIVCDRGVSHELVRHRIASFNQSSTRYCNYSKDKFGNEITVIKPCFWADLDDGFNASKYTIWERSMEACERAYLDLLELGATPQEARSVLPNSLKTDIVMTANLREWLHIFNLRCSIRSHPQMRQIMLPMLDEFYRRLPVVFGDVWAKYHKSDSQSQYTCDSCGLELYGAEGDNMTVGVFYPNGEFVPCPACGELNRVERG